MYHSNLTLKEGAIMIADAHYSQKEPHFLAFLKTLERGEIQTPQLILMGDIFDALFGGVPHTAKQNQEALELLNRLAQKLEIIYLEGNHDFQVHKFFTSKIKTFPIAKQPLLCHANGKKVALAHGDFDAPFGYQLYTYFIRNPFVLFVLNIFDSLTNHSILNFVDRHMQKKDNCKKFAWFDESFIAKRLKNLQNWDYFIDGHFHQNRSFKLNSGLYINLGAFACNQRYFVVKFKVDSIELQEMRL